MTPPAPASGVPEAARPRRAAVLGHPVAHSLSPVLHAAAYELLGLPWRYEPVDVTEDALVGFLAGLDESWVGLSLTMPLKKRVLPLVSSLDEVAAATGSANTVLWRGQGVGRTAHGFNTDVAGIVAALTEDDGAAAALDVDGAVVLGAGATAASAIAALAQLGASRATVLVRSVERAAGLREVASRLDVVLDVRTLDAWADVAPRAGVVVSTLPGGAADGLATQVRAARGALLDVAYAQRPTRLGAAWRTAGGSYVSGERMLLHQAVAQVRLFVESTGVVLDDVSAVTATMDEALQPHL